MARLLAFIRLGRPLFLAGGLVLHALGAAGAFYSGASFNLSALLWGQLGITAAQWMTHYSNDYFDLEADRANQTRARWSGGSRVLPAGLIAPWTALAAALALGGTAVLAACVLALGVATGPLTLPLFGLALLLAWAYSAPPLRLHSSGWGEAAAALLVAGLTPLTGFYLQRGRLELLPVLAVFPLMCLQFCMLLTIEFPDAAGDRAAGKRTLVVRLGTERAVQLYKGLLVLTYVSLPFLAASGLPWSVALAAGLMAPLAVWQAWRFRCGDHVNPARWDRLAFFSVALLTGTAAFETAAFLLLLGL